jgi:hypothetical protein
MKPTNPTAHHQGPGDADHHVGDPTRPSRATPAGLERSQPLKHRGGTGAKRLHSGWYAAVGLACRFESGWVMTPATFVTRGEERVKVEERDEANLGRAARPHRLPVRVAFVVLLAVLVASVGFAGRAVVGPSSSSKLYSVTTTVLVGGGLFKACFAEVSTSPPGACSGVQLRNVALSQLPVMQRYSNGVVVSGRAALTGHWVGEALQLTKRPQPRAVPVGSKPLLSCAHLGGTAPRGVVDRPIAHPGGSPGQTMLAFRPCVRGTVVLVPLATRAAKSAVSKMFGRPVTLVAWLQSANAGVGAASVVQTHVGPQACRRERPFEHMLVEPAALPRLRPVQEPVLEQVRVSVSPWAQ